MLMLSFPRYIINPEADCLELFRAGKVYVNGRLCENNSKPLEAGDVVNARGYGKFRISGEPHATRKGKLAHRG